MNREYCFCTLAIGKVYQDFALVLAEDLKKYAPEVESIVLTDNPKAFEGKSNVRAFPHKPVSCKIYHDKKYAIVKALSLYESCIFLDANIRIKDKVPDDINFQKGLVAYSCFSLSKLFSKEKECNPSYDKYTTLNIKYKLCERLSSYYNIDIEKSKFIFEGILYFTRHDRFKQFINYWELIGTYFENHGIYDSEGISIGLATALSELPVQYDDRKKISLFKDVLERSKISSGQATYEQNKRLFEELQQIENSDSFIIDKIKKKLAKQSGFYSRLILLKLRAYQYKDLFASFDRIFVPELKDAYVEMMRNKQEDITATIRRDN
jgi:hypothetical protein